MVPGEQGQVLNRAGVVGSPIAHSLSPVLHQAGYAARGLTDWRYSAREVGAGGLRAFVDGLDDTWRGLSVTMPLKEEALALAAQASDLAAQVGGANTLIRTGDGGWRADNTDVAGVFRTLDGDVRAGASAAVIGSGATARSVLAALHRLGVEQVCFVVRDQVRPPTLGHARDLGMTVRAAGLEDSAGDWADADVIVNTVPGTGADSAAHLLRARAPRAVPATVLECIYADWPSPFAQAALEAGDRVHSGLEMLVHQAADQFEQMTGSAAPVEAMFAAGRAATAESG